MACAAVALLIGGCSSASTNLGDSTGSGKGGTADEQLTARADAVLAMNQTDRNTALAKAGLDLELAVAKESGLEAALGGPSTTRDALLSAWAPLLAGTAASAGTPPTVGLLRAAPDVPELGEGFFGGYLATALSADSSFAAGTSGHTGPPESKTENGVTVTASASSNRGSFALEGSYVDPRTGVTTTLASSTSAVPCPDTDGRFEAEAVIDVTVSKGTAGQHGVLDVKVVGHVDDDAHLASSEMDYTMKWTRTSGGSTEMVSVAVSRATSAGSSRTVSHSGGASTSTLTQSADVGGRMYAMTIENALLQAAQRALEAGRCVRLDVVSDPVATAVKAGGTADITASPRSVIDGGPVGGNVTATISGKLTVEPNGSPLKADATFVYTAPTDGLPTSGTVSLEARSRRGVGKATIVYQIHRTSYVASGGGDDITFSGTTESPELFFSVEGTFQGGTATFDFTPDRTDDGDLLPTGVVDINGGGSDAKIKGSGTYTLVANEDGTLTVTMKTHACVDVSGACRDSTDTITLTPST